MLKIYCRAPVIKTDPLTCLHGSVTNDHFVTIAKRIVDLMVQRAWIAKSLPPLEELRSQWELCALEEMKCKVRDRSGDLSLPIQIDYYDSEREINDPLDLYNVMKMTSVQIPREALPLSYKLIIKIEYPNVFITEQISCREVNATTLQIG